ncbi:MAG: Na+/H+ antiporter NhaA [Bacteroidales bacterium]|nr:Na+/H+ antiporter NhaA [Bacteroidales bacterium]
MRKKTIKLFQEFTQNEKSGGLLLLSCTVFSLLATNFIFPHTYVKLWHKEIGGFSVLHFINDALMAVFFLLIGLELKREIREGELSSVKKAMLPVVGALGGMILPALIYIGINIHTGSIRGAGIPVATDIAFSLGVLSLLGKRVPLSLKIFLTALAVADDLGAILVIAFFYTESLKLYYLLGVIIVSLLLLWLSFKKIEFAPIYMAGGIILWFFMFNSGIHATLAGVILAFLLPSQSSTVSLSNKWEHILIKPVNFVILPLFALANTSIEISHEMFLGFVNPNTIGIMLGLFIGKPIGILGFSVLATKLKLCSFPQGVKTNQILGVSMLAGIGFTMSIFIAILSFEKSIQLDYSKIAVLIGSLLSGILGYVWLNIFLKKKDK